MKQIFFKTVRENYRSVYARGPLARTYVVGKRYRFPKDLPAHVFTVHNWLQNLGHVYHSRKEPTGGNRVLVCYGETEWKEVPCFDITKMTWDFTSPDLQNYLERKQVSWDFLVIDEIPLPDSYGGIRPSENDFYTYTGQIIPPPTKNKSV